MTSKLELQIQRDAKHDTKSHKRVKRNYEETQHEQKEKHNNKANHPERDQK